MSQLEEIFDLIRARSAKNHRLYAVTREDAIALIEQYGKAKAADEAVRCTGEAWDKAIATLSVPSTKGGSRG